MRIPAPIACACLVVTTLGCGGNRALPAPTAAPAPAAPLATLQSSAPPSAPAAVAPAVPLPDGLADAAGNFGLTMVSEGWEWKASDPHRTRFEWSGRPTAGGRELLYSFWMPSLGATERKLLPQLVASAAANLSDRDPCPPFDQPADILRVAGVERVITVCFEPSTFYGKEFKHGVVHGIVSHGALTIVASFSDDLASVIPLAKLIGSQGKR